MIALTVLVFAFDRSEFLSEALASVRAQVPDSGCSFETVVVTNLPDSVLPAELAEFGTCVVRPADPRLGRWLSEGVHASRGDVIALLDDDDRFHPDKLRTLASIFDSHPEVAYAHFPSMEFGESVDRRIVSDGPSATLPPSWTDRPYAGRRITTRQFRRLWRAGVAFNHSSVAVRRSLVSACEPDLSAIERGLTPTLFVAATSGREAIWVGSRPLSGRRVHGSNTSRLPLRDLDAEPERIRALARSRVRDAEIALAVARRLGMPEARLRPIRSVRSRYALIGTALERGLPISRRGRRLLEFVWEAPPADWVRYGRWALRSLGPRRGPE
jgi:hypothetical protein